MEEITSHCDGTLLTEKIVLSAAHCCRPTLIMKVASILYQLVRDKCELQKCQGYLVNEECIKAMTGRPFFRRCGDTDLVIFGAFFVFTFF